MKNIQLILKTPRFVWKFRYSHIKKNSGIFRILYKNALQKEISLYKIPKTFIPFVKPPKKIELILVVMGTGHRVLLNYVDSSNEQNSKSRLVVALNYKDTWSIHTNPIQVNRNWFGGTKTN